MKKNPENVEDIYDGRVYKNFARQHLLANQNFISFLMFFDGLCCFKNSKFSIWPIFLCILELNYANRTRREYVILAGMWFGKSKPNVNLFLIPLRDQMFQFSNEGVDFELPNGVNIRFKACILCAVGDLPAKAIFMRFIQYNGLYCCMHCMSSGGRFAVGRATVQVFPYTQNLELRSMEEWNNFARLAVIARRADPEANVYGVKGPSLLTALIPDMINSIGIDVMHGVFLNLMSNMLNFCLVLITQEVIILLLLLLML